MQRLLFLIVMMLSFTAVAQAQTTRTIPVDPNGNFGIGTTGPASKLEVVGTVTATGFSGDGSALTNVTATSGGGWTDGGANIFTTTTTDNVGIGTTTPVAELDITSTAANDLLRVNDNGPGDATPFLVNSVGNLGIGTSAPSSKLHISQSDPTTQIWSREGELKLQNFDTTVDAWTGIQHDSPSGDIAAGISFQNYDVGNDYAEISLSTRGASGFNRYALTVRDVNVGIGTFVPVAALNISSTATNDLFRINDNGPGDTTPLIVDSTGNVGIGSVGPNYKLDVNGTGAFQSTLYATGGVKVTNLGSYNWQNSNTTIQTQTGYAIPFLVGAGEKMRVDSTGSVGIGSVSPVANLDVYQTSAPTVVLHDTTAVLRIIPAAGSNYIESGSDLTAASVADLRFTGMNGSPAWMTIKGSGNVGIGTINPLALLSIGVGDPGSAASGDVYIKNDLEVDGTIYLADGTQLNDASDLGGASGWTDGGANIFTTTTTDKVGIGTTTPVAELDITSTVANDLLRVNDNGVGDASPFVITSAGNVGIGTSAPRGNLQLVDGSPHILISNTGAGTNMKDWRLTALPTFMFIGTLDEGTTTTGDAAITIARETNSNDVDYIELATNNEVNKMRYDNGGNLGVGTLNPRSVLDIVGTNGIFNRNSAGGGLYFDDTDVADGSTPISFITGVDGSLRFLRGNRNPGNGLTTGSSESMRIDASGNIGLGTSDPKSVFEISSTAAYDLLRVNDNGAGDASPFLVDATGNVGIGTSSPGIKLLVQDGTGGWVKAQSTGADSTAGFQLANDAVNWILKADGSQNDAFIVREANVGDYLLVKKTTGNIGVGTINPLALLSVGAGDPGSASTGDVYIKNDLEVDGIIYLADGTQLNDASDLGGASGWTDGGANVYTSSTTDNVGIGTFGPNALLDISSTAAQDLFRVNDNGTGDTSPFLITSTGRVGIGTFVTTAELTAVGSILGGARNSIVNYASAPGITNYLGVVEDALTDVPGIVLAINDGTNNPSISIREQATASSHSVIFDSRYTSGSGFANWVFNTGNVGIGTLTPRGALTVMSGNVGIGTFEPSALVHVYQNVSEAVATDTQLLNLTKYARSDIKTDSAVHVSFHILDDDRPAANELSRITVGAAANGAEDSGYLAFSTSDSGALREAMRLTSTGNVGVGTSTPVGALTVMNGNVGIGTWSPNSQLELKGNASIISTGGTNTNATGAGELYVQGDLEVDGTIYGDGSGLTSLPSTLAAGGWVDGGANVFQSTTTDNVGIGTTTPVAELDITSTAANDLLRINDNGPGDASPFLVDSAGNVGIGTTGAPVKLSVISNAAGALAEGMLLSNPNSASINTGIGLYFDPNGASASAPATSRAASIVSRQTTSGNFADLGFFTAPGNTPLERMTITTAGNVGIGTFGPNALLDISSTAAQDLLRINDNGTGDATPLIVDSTGNVGIGSISPLTALDVNGIATIHSYTNYYGRGYVGSSASLFTGYPAYLGVRSNGALYLGTNNDATAPDVTIDNNGNVGIGTVNPLVLLSVGTGDPGSAGAGDVYIKNDLEVDGTIYLADGTAITGASDLGAASGWTDDGANIFTTTAADNVGIGTTTPRTALDVMSAAPVISISSTKNGVWSLGESVGALQMYSSDANDNFPGVAAKLDAVIDTDTGGSNTGLAFSTALIGTLSERMRIASSGNVGIGTFAPNALFDVSSTAAYDLLRINDNGAGDATPFVVDSVGNVGLGTTAPLTALHVNTSTVAYTQDRGMLAITPSSDTNYKLSMGYDTAVGTNGVGYIQSLRTAVGRTSLILQPNGGNVGIGTIYPVNGTAIMNGNVGIGTWSPTSRLQVVGTVAATAFTGDGSGLTNVTATSGGGWTDGGPNVYTSTTTDNVGIGTTTPVATFDITSTAANDLLRVNDNGPGDASPFLIDSAGNVGIGTTAPSVPLSFGNAFVNTKIALFEDGVTRAGLGYQSNDFRLHLYSSLGSFNFYSAQAGTALMTIKGTGSVGIGTTTPVGGLAVMNGNVGIGTWSPQGAFVVVNGNVGIGTPTPNALLAVAGNSGTIAAFTANNPKIQLDDNNSSDIFFENSNGTLILSPNDGSTSLLAVSQGGTFNFNSGKLYLTTPGNLGIGTANPTALLSVGVGDPGQAGANDVYIKNDLEVDGTIYLADGTAITGASDLGAASGWTDGGPNVYTSTTTDNVGIGTTTPAAELDISSTAANDLLRVNDNGPGDVSPFVVDSTGNVGIGTSTSSETMTILPANNSGLVLRESDGENDVWRLEGGNSSGIIKGYSGGTQTIQIHSYATGDSYFKAGNVGVGTTTPFSELEISSTASNDLLRVNDNGPGDASPFVVDSTGNVGIGTSAPVAALQVFPLSSTQLFSNERGAVTIGVSQDPNQKLALGYDANLGTNGSGWIQAVRSGSAAVPLLLNALGGNVGLGTWAPNALLDVSSTAAYDLLRINDNGTGDATPFLIDSTGNVGVGTLSPSGKLAINLGSSDAADGLMLDRLNGGSIDRSSRLFFMATAGSFSIYNDAGSLKFSSNAVPGSTSGSPRMTLNSSGNLGIGTINPLATLAVGTGNPSYAGANDVFIKNDLEVAGSIYLADGTQLNDASDLGGASGWTDGGANIYPLTTTDNVGIGTTTPVAELDITSTASNDLLRVNDNGPGDASPVIIDSTGNVGIGTTSASAPLTFDNNFGNKITLYNTSNFGIGIQSSLMQFYVNDSARDIGFGTGTSSAFTPLVTFKGSGNVGIGTWAPNGLLDISSTAAYDLLRVNDNGTGDSSPFVIDSTGNVGVGTSVAGGKLHVFNGGGDAYAYITSNDGSHAAIYFGDVSDTVIGGFDLNNGDNSLNIFAGNNSTTRNIFLSGAGNVGVGTVNPLAQLSVGAGDPGSAAAGDVYIKNDLEVDGAIYLADGTPVSSASDMGAASGWRDGGANVYLGTTTDNVGIGTTTPVAALDITSTAANDLLRINDNGPADASPFIVDSTGNVGIGTSAPVAPLEIYSAGTPIFDINRSGSRYQFGISATMSGSSNDMTLTPNSASAGYIFKTINAGSGTINALGIDRNGNVGLGTITPVGGLAVMNGNVGIGTWSANYALEVVGTVYSNLGYRASNMDFGPTGITGHTSGNSITIGAYGNGLHIKTWDGGAAVEKVSVTSDGNVGIGTTSPVGGLTVMNGNVGIGTWSPTARLQIKGNIAPGAVTLTDAATIDTDASLGNHFRVTLGGNRTLGNPTNGADGQKVTWELIQDAGGTRTITLDTKFAFGTDITEVTLTTTANKRDFLGAIYNAATDKWYVVSFVKGY